LNLKFFSLRSASFLLKETGSIHGAPMYSKGFDVPRPSDRLIPSMSTMAVYTIADS